MEKKTENKSYDKPISFSEITGLSPRIVSEKSRSVTWYYQQISLLAENKDFQEQTSHLKSLLEDKRAVKHLLDKISEFASQYDKIYNSKYQIQFVIAILFFIRDRSFINYMDKVTVSPDGTIAPYIDIQYDNKYLATLTLFIYPDSSEGDIKRLFKQGLQEIEEWQRQYKEKTPKSSGNFLRDYVYAYIFKDLGIKLKDLCGNEGKKSPYNTLENVSRARERIRKKIKSPIYGNPHK